MSEVPAPDPAPATSGEPPADTGAAFDVDAAAFLPEPEPVDADQLSRDLDRVEVALEALDAKTYGIDQSTGERLSDARLAEDPTRLS